MNPEQLDQLILNLLEGEITSTEFTQLQEELRTNPAARQHYLDYIRQQNALELWASGQTALRAKDVIPMKLIMAKQKRRAIRMAMLSAAAVIAVVTIVAISIILPNPPSVSFLVSPNTVFTLTHSTPEGENTPRDMEIVVGSRLRVERGTVQLAFASGITGIIRGPADFTLQANHKIDLHSGIAWFHVPRKAVGFQVDTPDFLLTDLGTEFGVVSKPEIAAEIHVFNGAIEALHHRTGDSIQLTNSMARIAASSGWKEIDFNPALFVTNLPADNPAPPYLHFPFDSIGEVLGTHQQAANIVVERGFENQGPHAIDGPVGRALSFDKERDFLMTNWPGISGNSPRSIAFWLRLPSPAKDPSYSSTLLSWGNSEPRDKNECWAIRVRRDDPRMIPQNRSRLRNNALLQVWLGAYVVHGSTDLADGHWHHIAVSYDGKTTTDGRPNISCYVDGKSERTDFYPQAISQRFAPLNTKIKAQHCLPLLIGRSKTQPDSSCNADLDELFIFEGSLSPDLIYSLAHPENGWTP